MEDPKRQHPGFTPEQIRIIESDAADFVSNPPDVNKSLVAVEGTDTPFRFDTPKVLQPKRHTEIEAGIRSEETVPANNLYNRYAPKEKDTEPDLSILEGIRQAPTVPASVILDREAPIDSPSKEHIQKVIGYFENDQELISLLIHPTNVEAIYTAEAQNKVVELIGDIKRADIQALDPKLQNDHDTQHFQRLLPQFVAEALIIAAKDIDYSVPNFVKAKTALLGRHKPQEIVGKLTPIRIEDLVKQYQRIKAQGMYDGAFKNSLDLLDDSAEKLSAYAQEVRAQQNH